MFGTELRLDERGLHGGTVGHFFGAFRIDALRDGGAFGRDLARELSEFENSAPAPGAERVVTAGSPSARTPSATAAKAYRSIPKVWDVLDVMAERLKIEKLERFTVD